MCLHTSARWGSGTLSLRRQSAGFHHQLSASRHQVRLLARGAAPARARGAGGLHTSRRGRRGDAAELRRARRPLRCSGRAAGDGGGGRPDHRALSSVRRSFENNTVCLRRARAPQHTLFVKNYVRPAPAPPRSAERLKTNRAWPPFKTEPEVRRTPCTCTTSRTRAKTHAERPRQSSSSSRHLTSQTRHGSRYRPK